MTDQEPLIAELRTLMRGIQPRLPQEWGNGASFTADLNLDSLDLVELVARVEQRYRVLIPDSDLAQFTSLDAVVDYLVMRLAA